MTDKRKQLAAFTRALPPTSRLRALHTTRIANSKEGRDFSVKMDIASIPKIESIVLMGLDFSMRPENVRLEASKGYITPLPENRVMHQIKKLALMVYNQEKFSSLYHANVCDTSNPLAYFLCAVHRQTAPQPQQKKDRHASVSSDTSASSEKSSNSQTSCTSAGKNCGLPQLTTSSILPLGYWDGLYYALVVEIRRLHSDLQEKFGWAIEDGVHPLHYSGLDNTKEEPVTPIDLASMLEAAWYHLMDTRLVAALDDAVRMRKMRDNAAKKRTSTSTKASSNSDDSDDDHHGGDRIAYEKPPVDEGLVDVNGMTSEAITEMLWKTHAPEVDQACSEDFEDESMLTAYRAELYAQTTEQSLMLNGDGLVSSTCRCHGKCVCQLRCDVHASHCTCAPRAQIYHKVTKVGLTEGEAPSQFIKQDVKQEDHFVEGTSNLLTEMEFKPDYASALKDAQAPHDSVMDEVTSHKMPSRYKNRQRANTNNSQLAYVPDSKASRGKGKDAYPLDFYDNGSPGRYPKIRKETFTTAKTGAQATNVTADNRVPARKPVPAPLMPVQPYVAPDAGYGVVTPPSDNRFNPNAFTMTKAQAAYLENERLRQTMHLCNPDTVIRSIPITAKNPRKAANSDPFVDGAAPSDPADDYAGLLARQPSSFEQTENTTEAFPTLTRSATTTPPRATKTDKVSASTTNLPTLKSMTGNTSKPMPPLPPLPDFIAPRPATVQRYVSAGGNVPLAQRAPIQGPAFNSTGVNTPVNHASGAGILKAEIDAKMSDPEWVEKHFGAAAAERVSLSPPRKLRESSESAVVADSQRSSREAYSRASVEPRNPRDRTSSGVSARLKRVFSRKNSEHESFD